HLPQHIFFLLHVPFGPSPRHCLNPSHPSSNARFFGDLKQTNCPQSPRVCSTAQLFRKRNVDHTDHIAVFLPEKLFNFRPLLCFFETQLIRLHGNIVSNLCIHQIFNLTKFFRRQWLVVTEVKSKPFVFHERPCLLDVGPKHFVQSPVQQVCGRVV